MSTNVASHLCTHGQVTYQGRSGGVDTAVEPSLPAHDACVTIYRCDLCTELLARVSIVDADGRGYYTALHPFVAEFEHVQRT